MRARWRIVALLVGAGCASTGSGGNEAPRQATFDVKHTIDVPIPEGAKSVRVEGFAPLKELMDAFANAGGTIWVCSPCFKKRSLDEGNLVPGATIVGGAKLVEFLGDGSPCVSY